MRVIFLSFAVLLTGCSETILEDFDEGIMSKTNSKEQTEIEQPTPNLEAEARLTPVLDALKNEAFNLSSNCTEATKINLESGKVFVGTTKCDLENVKVYLGSAEVEYKVKNCSANGSSKELSYFVFGSNKMSSYYIVSDNEIQDPIFVCS